MDERSTIHVGKYTSPMDPVGISSPKFNDGNCFGPNGTFMLLHQSQTTHEISIFPSGHEIIFLVKLMDVWKTTLTQYQLHNDISRESKGTVPPQALLRFMNHHDPLNPLIGSYFRCEVAFAAYP